MQLELFVSEYSQKLNIKHVNLDEYLNILPKHIEINLVDDFPI